MNLTYCYTTSKDPSPSNLEAPPEEESTVFITTGRHGQRIKPALLLHSCATTRPGFLQRQTYLPFLKESLLHLFSLVLIKAGAGEDCVVCLLSCFKDKMQCSAPERRSVASDVGEDIRRDIFTCDVA